MSPADGNLEARIQRLEDAEAIRHLKMTYAQRCDDGYDADAIWRSTPGTTSSG